MTTHTDRVARVRDWEKLAEAASAFAGRPDSEAPASLIRFADYAERWPWPRATDTRCRAFQAVLKVAVLTRPGSERASLGPALKLLAGLVLESCGAVRAAAVPEPVRDRCERKDIFG